MKKYFLIASIVLAPFFTSCEGDDSNDSNIVTNTPEDGEIVDDNDDVVDMPEDGGDNGDSGEVTNTFETDLIGTWELVSYTSNGQSFFTCGDIETYDGTHRQYDEVWGDNCENISLDDEELDLYTVEGDVLTVTVPAEIGPDGEVSDEGFTEAYTITLLDESNLTLEDTYTEDGVDFVDISKYIRK